MLDFTAIAIIAFLVLFIASKTFRKVIMVFIAIAFIVASLSFLVIFLSGIQ